MSTTDEDGFRFPLVVRTRSENARNQWERATVVLSRKRGESVLSKVSQVSGVSFRSSDTGRGRADSSVTVASTFLPQIPVGPFDNIRRSNSRTSLQLQRGQRSESRMSATQLRRAGGFRAIQAVSGFRRRKKRTEISLGLEDIVKRNDLEWKQKEMLEHQRNPRFSSTLSPESRYLMLKGYEDILREHLVQLYPDKREMLRRIETPEKIESLTDALKMNMTIAPSVPPVLNQHSKCNSMNKFAMDEERKNPNNSLLSSSDDSSALTILKDSFRRQDSFQSNSFTPLPEELERSDGQEVSEGNELWNASYRLQNAMDALDKMKIADGETVTSERYKTKQMDPLTFFNYWACKWREEFQIGQPQI